jgi:hypothetical protein
MHQSYRTLTHYKDRDDASDLGFFIHLHQPNNRLENVCYSPFLSSVEKDIFSSRQNIPCIPQVTPMQQSLYIYL